MSNGNSFSAGNGAAFGYLGGKTTERECLFIRRLLQAVEQRV